VSDPIESAGATPAPRPALVALSHRDFRRFWLGALVSNTGGWMQNAAVPYVAFTLTGSPGDVGITGFFQYVPFMLMGLVGGVLADRYPRRALLIGAQLAQAACAFALWALVASDSATIASLSALAFLSGLAGGVNTPIWQSFVTELVPRDVLLNAVTLNSAQFNAARALGPFLAGVVIAAWGVATAFAINGVSFLVVIGVLVVIRGTSDARERPDSTTAWSGIRRGAAHVVSSPAILACCVAIIAVAGLGSPLFSYLSVYGESVYEVTGWQLGLLFGAAGIGSVLFTPLLLSIAPRLPRARLLGGAMLLYGVSVAAMGLAPTYAASIVVLLAFGGAYLSIASTINTTIQLVVREELRGVVIAIYLMCLTGALPLGLFVWGEAADAIGIRATTVAAGIALALVTVGFIVTRRFAVMAEADDARDAAAAG
jgi:MFS family permease